MHLVYLRPFKVDAAPISRKLFARASFSITDVVASFCADNDIRLSYIARPGSQPGAGRQLVTWGDWRDHVNGLLDSATHAVIVTGSSQGTAWEIEALAGKHKLRKLAILDYTQQASNSRAMHHAAVELFCAHNLLGEAAAAVICEANTSLNVAGTISGPNVLSALRELTGARKSVSIKKQTFSWRAADFLDRLISVANEVRDEILQTTRANNWRFIEEVQGHLTNALMAAIAVYVFRAATASPPSWVAELLFRIRDRMGPDPFIKSDATDFLAQLYRGSVSGTVQLYCKKLLETHSPGLEKDAFWLAEYMLSAVRPWLARISEAAR